MKFNINLSRSFLGLCFLVLVGVGCKSTIKVVKTGTIHSAKAELANALLWEISGNKLDQSSYLFGTIHLIDKKDFFYPEGLLSALDKSKEVYFEIDLAEMNDMESQMGLLTKAFMSDGSSLSSLLSTEDYKIVKTHFDKIGLPLILFERVKPMFLTVMSSMDGDIGKMQEDMTSYEMELMSIAQKSNKEVRGLETMDFQISLFDSIPYIDQAEMLVEGIKNSDASNEAFVVMMEQYKQQDIVGLYKSLGNDENVANYQDVLVNARNKNWIPIMKTAMLGQPTFFAVGAGHLAGPEGVINLLRDKGYTVRPVK